MIRCEGLSKVFPLRGGGAAGVFDVDLAFEGGRIYGVLGYNGAGKTTLFRCVEGLYLPTAGRVTHDGVSTAREKEFLEKRRRIAFLPTDDFAYEDLTCGENLELTAILRTGSGVLSRETRRLLRYFDVEGFLRKRFRDCSTGMRKKLQLILSLTGEVDTILWDEPNDGLDLLANLKLKKLLEWYKGRGATILISCHVLEFLRDFIDEAVILREGRVAARVTGRDQAALEEVYLGGVDPGFSPGSPEWEKDGGSCADNEGREKAR